jgi:hypothetical protein
MLPLRRSASVGKSRTCRQMAKPAPAANGAAGLATCVPAASPLPSGRT